jgi:hypothetical protein
MEEGRREREGNRPRSSLHRVAIARFVCPTIPRMGSDLAVSGRQARGTVPDRMGAIFGSLSGPHVREKSFVLVLYRD